MVRTILLLITNISTFNFAEKLIILCENISSVQYNKNPLAVYCLHYFIYIGLKNIYQYLNGHLETKFIKIYRSAYVYRHNYFS